MIQAYAFKTELGSMALSWSEGKISAIFMPEKNSVELLEQVRKKISVPNLRWEKNPPRFVLEMAKKITKHLMGETQLFSLDSLNLDGTPRFHRKVYEQTIKIPNGKVYTYGELAKKAGSPKAFRAVGQAMAKNPYPIVIPCHRVVGSSGKLVGYSAPGGTETKKKILAIESSHGSANKS